MPLLRSIAWKPGVDRDRGFPFDVPALASLDTLDVDAAVTFFVGENGTGKSTLLEGVAFAAGLPAVASADLARDPTLAAQRRLGSALRLAWRRRATRGFFLRAEDFFGYAKRLARERTDLQEALRATETEYAVEYSKRLAQGPLRASLAGMERRYGEELDAASHGEGFLRLFRSRIVPGGVHLLDEPEAALSPQSQLGLLALMMDAVRDEAQFIIATHSPILLAFPDARILSFDETPVRPVAYDDLEHVRLTRAFLEAPERYLRQL
jgi:predicted ATPase